MNGFHIKQQNQECHLEAKLKLYWVFSIVAVLHSAATNPSLFSSEHLPLNLIAVLLVLGIVVGLFLKPLFLLFFKLLFQYVCKFQEPQLEIRFGLFPRRGCTLFCGPQAGV